MTNERIAELRREYPRHPGQSGDVDSDMNECLDDIERLQNERAPTAECTCRFNAFSTSRERIPNPDCPFHKGA